MKQDNLNIEGDKLSLLIKKEEIASRIQALGEQISKDSEGKRLTILCVLNGAFMFASDLMRAYDGLCEFAFLKLSSYEGTETTGKVTMKGDFPCDLKGKDVLIVEDIIDTGITMDYLVKLVKSKQPNSVKVAVCFDKYSRRQIDVDVDYIAFKIEDKFIVGYGLDYNGLYRNLPDIYTK